MSRDAAGQSGYMIMCDYRAARAHAHTFRSFSSSDSSESESVSHFSATWQCVCRFALDSILSCLVWYQQLITLSNGPKDRPVFTANTHVFTFDRVFHLNTRIHFRFSRIRHMNAAVTQVCRHVRVIGNCGNSSCASVTSACSLRSTS